MVDMKFTCASVREWVVWPIKFNTYFIVAVNFSLASVREWVV